MKVWCKHWKKKIKSLLQKWIVSVTLILSLFENIIIIDNQNNELFHNCLSPGFSGTCKHYCVWFEMAK